LQKLKGGYEWVEVLLQPTKNTPGGGRIKTGINRKRVPILLQSWIEKRWQKHEKESSGPIKQSAKGLWF